MLWTRRNTPIIGHRLVKLSPSKQMKTHFRSYGTKAPGQHHGVLGCRGMESMLKKWTQEMSKSDIVLNGIKLTNTGKLTQGTLRNL